LKILQGHSEVFRGKRSKVMKYPEHNYEKLMAADFRYDF
jgi:hypothetical protein